MFKSKERWILLSLKSQTCSLLSNQSDIKSGLIAKLPCFNRLLNCIDISDRESINNTLCEFTNIVWGIADPLFKRHVFCNKLTQFIDNPINDKDWFDNDCSQAKQRYMEAQRVFFNDVKLIIVETNVVC